MVIIICWGANCQAIWERFYYPSVENCLAESTPVKEYMMKAYPDSSGEIYCMNQEEFENYYEYLQNGGSPSLNSEFEPSAS
jgi:hypothetical protein